MKAAITSEETRTAGSTVKFDIDELNYNPETTRVITKSLALNGTTITTNWGYPEGNIIITISNVLIDRADYDVLVSMKEDDDYSFLFNYKNSTWKIALQGVTGVPANDEKMLTTLTLSVIEKYADGETS